MRAERAQGANALPIKAEPAGKLPVFKIQPSRGWGSVNWRELWEYRELLYFLMWRDVKIRYKQTVLGAAWAVIQPFFMMVVFSIFFGHLAKVPSDNLPYPIFAYSALVPWQFFANAITQSGNSLVGNQHVISKVYFPRLIIPISSVLTGIIDFAIAFCVLLLMMLYYGIAPSLTSLSLLLFLLLTVATAMGVGFWLSAMNVQYRDIRFTIPFLTQFWMFATPIAYPTSIVPEAWRTLYGINPMTGVVEGFRWALLGKGNAPGPMLAVSVAVVAILFLTGLFYFRRMERTFADII